MIEPWRLVGPSLLLFVVPSNYPDILEVRVSTQCLVPSSKLSGNSLSATVDVATVGHKPT